MKFSFTRNFWLSSIEVTLESMGKGKNVTFELPLVRDQYRVYPSELENADKYLSDLYTDCTVPKYSFKTYITCINKLSESVGVPLSRLLDMEMEWELGDSSAEADAKRRRINESSSSRLAQEADVEISAGLMDVDLGVLDEQSGDDESEGEIDFDFGQDFGVGLETATDPISLSTDLGSIGMEFIANPLDQLVLDLDQDLQEPFIFSKIIINTLNKYLKLNVALANDHMLYLNNLRNIETNKTLKKQEEILLSELAFALMGTTEGLSSDEKSVIKLCTRSSMLRDVFRQEYVSELDWRKYRGNSKYIRKITTVGDRADISESD